MKKLIGLSFLLGAILITSSCVGRKKYINSLSKLYSAEEREDQLEKRLDNANVQLRQVMRENGLLENQIQKLEAEKAGQRIEISNLISDIDQISSQSMSAQSRLDHALQAKAAALKKREEVLSVMQNLRQKNDAAATDVQMRIFSVIGAYSEYDIKVETRDGNVVIMLLDNLLFNGAKKSISEKGKDALKELTQAIATHPEMSISVVGHTNKTGEYNDALTLSVLRATEVTRFLAEMGLPASRITTSGKGAANPRFGEANHIENQRTEIILSPRFQEIYRVLKRSTL